MTARTLLCSPTTWLACGTCCGEMEVVSLVSCLPVAAVFRYAFEEPCILCSFLNAALDFEGDQRIDSMEYLPQELPSSDPNSLGSYRFTVDVSCRSKDGRHFLIEIQNDFRGDYNLK